MSSDDDQTWTPTPEFLALREAWLDVPFNGVVDVGTADWLQPLVNAVSAIVDPDRQLRDTPEALRRGRLSSYRSQHARFNEQAKLAAKLVEKFGDAHAEDLVRWTAKCDEIAAQCLAEFGVHIP